MNRNCDEPLFSASRSDESVAKEKLELEKYKARQDGKKFDKILGFSGKIVLGIAILSGILLILDLIAQRFELDNSLIVDCFSLLKYTLTSILGFIFGSNFSNHNNGN